MPTSRLASIRSASCTEGLPRRIEERRLQATPAVCPAGEEGAGDPVDRRWVGPVGGLRSGSGRYDSGVPETAPTGRSLDHFTDRVDALADWAAQCKPGCSAPMLRVSGVSGAGKTVLLRHLAEECRRSGRPAVLLDTSSVWRPR
jgi:hypothetical protein